MTDVRKFDVKALESYIGLVSKDYHYDVTVDDVQEFSNAVAHPNDLLPVSPVYFTKLRDGEFEILEKMGISLADLLHGEQEYEYFSDIKIGVSIVCHSRLKNMITKKNGELIILEVETPFHVKDAELPICKSLTTFIVRNK